MCRKSRAVYRNQFRRCKSLSMPPLCMVKGQALMDNVYRRIGPSGAKVG
jgi:hypothetical protein